MACPSNPWPWPVPAPLRNWGASSGAETVSDILWQTNQSHPAIDLLMLHVEGELESKEAAAVARHVKDCWDCRTTCERLEQGIFHFMEFHNGAQIPAPPPSRHPFSHRLRD